MLKSILALAVVLVASSVGQAADRRPVRDAIAKAFPRLFPGRQAVDIVPMQMPAPVVAPALPKKVEVLPLPKAQGSGTTLPTGARPVASTSSWSLDAAPYPGATRTLAPGTGRLGGTNCAGGACRTGR